MQMICDRDHHKHCACESCLKGLCDSTFHAAQNLSSVRLENWDQCGRIHHDTRAGIANLGFEGLPNQTGMYWFAKTKATCRTGLHKWNVVVAFKRTECTDLWSSIASEILWGLSCWAPNPLGYLRKQLGCFTSSIGSSKQRIWSKWYSKQICLKIGYHQILMVQHNFLH